MEEDRKIVTKERLDKEFARIKEALEETEMRDDLDESQLRGAVECLDTATRYTKDAEYFAEKGDFATAFGALNYAFGFIDAGLKLQVFVKKL